MSQGANPFRNPAERESDFKYENMLNQIEFAKWERILDIASGTTTTSESGQPFRTWADDHSQPQESESKHEERLTYMERERILDVLSRDSSFGPPSKMMVYAPLPLPHSSVRKHGGKDLDDEFCWKDQYEARLYRDHHLQHEQNRNRQRLEHHYHNQHQRHRHNGQHQYHHYHGASNFNQEYMNDSFRLDIGSRDPSRCRISHPDSSRYTTNLSTPTLVIPKPTSITDNHYGRFQSKRHWCEDDESPSDHNQWSPKRLICGVQVKEVGCVTPEFLTAQLPPKREGRPYSILHSLDSQDDRKTIQDHQVHWKERLNVFRRSIPLGFENLSMNRLSPKQVICDIQDNEVKRVDSDFRTNPSPPKREGCLYSSVHSVSSANGRKTSLHHKVHLQKRLDDWFLLGLISHSMNLSREKKPAKPAHDVHRSERNVHSREWYERSDSMKGKPVSDHPHFMFMVFFEKVGEEPSKEDGSQSCTA